MNCCVTPSKNTSPLRTAARAQPTSSTHEPIGSAQNSNARSVSLSPPDRIVSPATSNSGLCSYKRTRMISLRENVRQPNRRYPTPTQARLKPMTGNVPIHYLGQIQAQHDVQQQDKIIDPFGGKSQFVGHAQSVPGIRTFVSRLREWWAVKFWIASPVRSTGRGSKKWLNPPSPVPPDP
jgi:hypothetical protein